MIEALQGAWEAIMTGALPDVGMWSYLIIFLMVFIEGPVVTLIAGAMVGAGLLRLDLAYAACAIGNFLADQFWNLPIHALSLIHISEPTRPY